MTIKTKEEQMFVRRLKELAETAFYKEIDTFTDFLTLNEISLFHTTKQEFSPVAYSLSGGFPDAERKLICFHGGSDSKTHEIMADELPPDFYYPVSCLRIQPGNIKFAEALTHRDYLGAILNLGIERKKLGDLVFQENEVFLFCVDSIADFLLEQLTCVRHTKVTAERAQADGLSLKTTFETIHSTVSSIRLDAVTAAAFHVSRSRIVPVIAQGKVFVNGKETTDASHPLQEGDIISVRGFGKVKYETQGNLSKKGRINITLLKYS